MIICVDFDGTIVEHEYPAIGRLQPGAVRVLKRIKYKGHTVIIWTCRYVSDDLDAMAAYLKAVGIPYDKINANADGVAFVPWPKVYGDIYIDDHNLGGFPGWGAVEKILKDMGAL